MRQCVSCGKQNPDDQDFCSCGEYLRWEPTGYFEAIKPPEAEAEPEAAAVPPVIPAVQVTQGEPVKPENGNGNGHAQPATPSQTAAQTPAVAPKPPSTPVSRPVNQTLVRGAVPTPPREAEPAQQIPSTITLRLPEGDFSRSERLHQIVDPGQTSRVLAMVRNQSGVVDNYDLRIEGLPEDWYSIYPETVYLVPFGAGGTYEQEVEIHLHPPRSPEAEAREWDLKVVADSRAHRVVAAFAPLSLHVDTYIELATTLRPQRKKGRRRANFDVTVANKGNGPVVVALDGEDPDGELIFGFNRPPQEIPRGAIVTTQMQVKPPKQIWLGRSRDHQLSVRTVAGEEAQERAAAEPLKASIIENAPPPKKKKFWQRRPPHVPGVYPPRVYKPQLYAPDVQMGPGGPQIRMPQLRAPQVSGPRLGSVNAGNMVKGKVKMPARPGGAPAAPQVPLMPTQGIFRQKQWITWWLPLLLVMLVVLLLLLYKLFATNNVVVPDVVGQKKAFDAQTVLAKSSLKLGKTDTKVDDSQPAGTVLKQAPEPKKEVAKGSTVDILIATGSGNVKVPSIVGLDPAAADHALREKSLTLGSSSPPNADPKAKIASQVPAVGEVVKAGAAINIFFPDPNAAGAKKDGKDAGKDGAKSGSKTGANAAGGAKDILVPPIAKKQTADDYAKAAGALGIVPVVSRQFNDAPAGTPLSTVPPAGTKVKNGTKVKVFVSAGQPQVVFTSGDEDASDQRDIQRISGANGDKFEAVAKTSADEADATWTADGQHVAYASNGQVMLLDISKKNAKPAPVTNDGKIYKDLAWAPTTDSQVLAMDQLKDDGDSDLCLGDVKSNGTDIQCLAEPGFSVTRAIHWASDGRALYATGVKSQGVFGVVRWKVKDGKHAFSTDIADWSKGHFLTDLTKGTNKGVLEAVPSPDGKRLALVSNIGSSAFRLQLTEAGDFDAKKAVRTKQRACQVTWRSDSKALLIVQGAADCHEDSGPLMRVDATATSNARALNAEGKDPSFQPITVGG